MDELIIRKNPLTFNLHYLSTFIICVTNFSVTILPPFISLQKQFTLFPKNRLICVPLFFQKCQLTNEGCHNFQELSSSKSSVNPP
ncbi:MAG: hypothetical protein B6245_04335 [Desulfobacteraceae bacterium 4572_88]|nr:MAG: hypothetical protein B6245_04335 [Desulfobacteraceae bacterium 4572_88]